MATAFFKHYLCKQMDFIAKLLFLLICSGVMGQSYSERQNLIDEINRTKYIDSGKAIKIAEYLHKNSGSDKEKAESLLLLSEIFFLKGNYDLSVENSFEAKRYAELSDSKLVLAKALLQISSNCRNLGIYDKAEEYLEEFSKLRVSEMSPQYYREKAVLNLHRENNKEALTDLEASFLFYQKKGDKPGMADIYNEIAQIYLAGSSIDSADHYFEKTLKLLEDKGQSIYSKYATLGLASILARKEKFESSVKSLSPIIKEIENSEDIVLKEKLYDLLSESYYQLNDLENYKSYIEKLENLNELVSNSENKAKIILAEKIDKEYENKIRFKEKRYRQIIVISLFAIVVIVLTGYLINKAMTKELKSNKIIIQQIGKKKIEVINENNESKSNPISQKTEQILLEKLKQFEKSNQFTNPEISLNSLAKQLDTNRKYLSEIINKHKNKNFNAYINELRVNYIIEKLKTNPSYLNYKISYLAEECGFSSHSLFAAVFKSVAGISPTIFINFLTKELKKDQG